jgi:ABC-type Na+ efflux pump permease subunit
MKKCNAVVLKEWLNFKGSERGLLLVYGILVLAWSFFPLNKELGAGPIWWLFFSVIICGNFTNTVFVSERLNGSMEILLTSGFPRNSVLFGKIAFVLLISIVMGMLCFCLSMVWLRIAGREKMFLSLEVIYNVLLFCCGVLMNVAFGAWMSFRLQSPRLIPFMTVMVMGGIVAGFYGLVFLFGLPQWTLGLILTIAAVIFGLFARKEFHGEKVIQPIHL